MEIGSDVLNFLDLTLIKKDGLIFNWYRKPTDFLIFILNTHFYINKVQLIGLSYHPIILLSYYHTLNSIKTILTLSSTSSGTMAIPSI